jgi:branched-subunit amino acid aminotransferase/4-amino-4-deoxychorismate lyase
MSVPLAYLGGRFLPAPEASLSIADAGLVFAATVTDFCRTFAHRLFRWEDHLARFRRDCRACFVPLPASDDELTGIALRLVEHNARLLPPGGELALVSLATPGSLGTYAGMPGQDGPPSLCLHTFGLPLARYRRFFTEGVALALAGTHGSSADDLAPPHVKHRSRLHWWRADHLLRQRGDIPPGALALLTDAAGHLTETAIGNLLVVQGEVVCTPPAASVLDGISLRVVRELCGELGVAVVEQPLTAADLAAASEAMLCGTAFCLAGVRWFEGHALAWPGPLMRRLLTAWSGRVGLDIAAQVLAAQSA